jgi:allantoinase
LSTNSGEENREALWRALFENQIDMIVFDHSPASPDVKCLDSGDFMKAWGGIAGLQFRLS